MNEARESSFVQQRHEDDAVEGERTRRAIVTIALLAAQGRESQLRDHIRGARLGEDPLTEEEIQEILVHVAHYAGWAAGASGQAVAASVLEQLRR